MEAHGLTIDQWEKSAAGISTLRTAWHHLKVIPNHQKKIALLYWNHPPGKQHQKNVIQQWGEPESSDIMIKDGNIIIPKVSLGNLILIPQPTRGFGEDPVKLYHDPKIYPHHQYIAFYLYLANKSLAGGWIFC